MTPRIKLFKQADAAMLLRRRNAGAVVRSPHPVNAKHRGLRGRILVVLVVTAVLVFAQASSASATVGLENVGRSQTVLVWSQYDASFSTVRVMLSDSAGGHARAITHPPDGAIDLDPQVSPDGIHVLFERDLPPFGIVHIGTVRIDGSEEHLLDLGCVDPCAGDLMPNWTPDSRHLTWTRVVGPFDPDTGDAQSAVLWLGDLAGKHQRRLSPPGIELKRCEEYGAQYAPAGYTILTRLCAGLGLTVVRRETNGRERLLTPWSVNADLPDISPATVGPTKDLVVFETPTPNGSTAVATVPSTCRDQAECAKHIRYLTSPNSQPDQNFNPAWSPDGRTIAYVRFTPGIPPDVPPAADIWTMKWNGANKQPVVTSPLFDFRPEWGQR